MASYDNDDADSSESQAEMAWEAMRAGENARAIAICDQILTRDADDLPALYITASALLQMNKPKEAAEYATRLQTAAPKSQYSHLISARMQTDRGFIQRAQQHYEMALELSDRELPVLIEYGEFLAIHRSPRVAQEILDEAIEIAPNDPAAMVALARLRWRQLKVPQAESLLKGVLRQDPDHLGARTMMADLLISTGRTAKSDALAELISDDPHSEEYLEHHREVRKRQRQASMLFEREDFRSEALQPSWLSTMFARLWIIMGAVLIVLFVVAVMAGISNLSPRSLIPAVVIGGALVAWWINR